MSDETKKAASGKLVKKDEASIQAIVKFAVTEAIDFIESEIAEERNKAQRYFDGEVDMGFEEGRSSVVATKIRDTVRTIVPNLMRTFLASEHPVEFIPRKPEDALSTEQATKYVAAEFERMDGFRILTDVMNDACTKKTGFIKAWWEDEETTTFHKFTNLTDEELMLLMNEEDIEITEQETEEGAMAPPPEVDPMAMQQDPMAQPQMGGGMDPMAQGVQQAQQPPKTHKVTLTRTSTKGAMHIQLIPPEDFFIDSSATCLQDAYCYGHQCEMRVTDLVAMGIPFEDVIDLGGMSAEEDDTTEKYERADYTDDNDNVSHDDPSMKLITVTEAYMRIDIEGDGIAVLHRFLLAGKEYKVLEMEPWNDHCIAVFESDPIAHLFFGNSIPDLLFNDQDAATSMMRGILDNIQLTNNPRTEVNDDMVNMDDMMNNEIGGLVRSKAVGQSINPLVVEFIAGQTLPAMQYFDQQIEAKTGINSVTSGLNGDELQNQTATAVSAMKQAGATQIESIARHIGRGLADLFKIMLKLLVENSDEEVLMRLSGNEFVQMDPRSWNTDMDTIINVGLGNGREGEKQNVLSQALALQERMGMAGVQFLPEPMRATVGDMMAIGGIRNVDKYFPPEPPADPNAQQGQPPADDPGQAIIESEKIKAAASTEQKMAELKFKMFEMSQKDDLERDQMAQDLQIEFAKILGQYGSQVDVAGIKEEQATIRQGMPSPDPQPQGQPQGMPQGQPQQPGPQGPPMQ